ncbi:MAG: hypothetical protein K2Q25_04450 [Mycobacteriaceae bacterium]|nr:hypothetical protein [Mycobacteriaceae bacterium]
MAGVGRYRSGVVDVDPRVQDFADQVIDRLLVGACDLFANTTPGSELFDAKAEAAGAPTPSSGDVLAERVSAAGNELARAHSAVHRLDEASGQAVTGAGEMGADDRSWAEQLRQDARAQARAILPLTNSAAGIQLLVSAMDERLGALQQRIDTTKKAHAAVVTELHKLADGYGQARVPHIR